jgi:hypothetical protein
MSKFRRVSAAAVDEAEKSNNPALQEPPTARTKGEAKLWVETVKIVGVSSDETESQKGDDHLVLTIDTEVEPGGTGGDLNVGKRVQYRGRINWDAYEKANKNDGQFKMSRGTVGVMGGLFREVGIHDHGDIEPETWDAAFPDDEGETSPLIGYVLDAYIKQEPNDSGQKWPEIRRFLLADSSGSNHDDDDSDTL